MYDIWRWHGWQRASLVRFLFSVKRNALAAGETALKPFEFKIQKRYQLKYFELVLEC